MIDDLQTGPVELAREELLSHSHADRVGETLTERPGGGFNPDVEVVFRVTRGARAELAEILDFVDGERIAGKIQDRIQEHRSVAVREHEPVPVDPAGIAGIVLEDA